MNIKLKHHILLFKYKKNILFVNMASMFVLKDWKQFLYTIIGYIYGGFYIFHRIWLICYFKYQFLTFFCIVIFMYDEWKKAYQLGSDTKTFAQTINDFSLQLIPSGNIRHQETKLFLLSWHTPEMSRKTHLCANIYMAVLEGTLTVITPKWTRLLEINL